MKKITKFFIFLLLIASLAGNFLSLNIWQKLKASSEAGDRRNINHWLSIQSRVEDLEEAAAVFWASESEEAETETETESETETKAETETASENETASETDAVSETETEMESETENEAVTEAV